MNIKELRICENLTQAEAASILNMSRRGCQELEYNNNENSRSFINVFEKISEYNKIDEEHGILFLKDIKSCVYSIMEGKDVDYCILFGSYARNEAKENSDVDILISTNINGLDYFGLIEELREKLHKKVDLIRTEHIDESKDLLLEILKDGVKIYDSNKR